MIIFVTATVLSPAAVLCAFILLTVFGIVTRVGRKYLTEFLVLTVSLGVVFVFFNCIYLEVYYSAENTIPVYGYILQSIAVVIFVGIIHVFIRNERTSHYKFM